MPALGGEANGSPPSNAARVIGVGSSAAAGVVTSEAASSAVTATAATLTLPRTGRRKAGHLGMGDSSLRAGSTPASSPTLGPHPPRVKTPPVPKLERSHSRQPAVGHQTSWIK